MILPFQCISMKKLDYIRRDVRISDINSIIETLNSIIDKLQTKEVVAVLVERKVKDFKFFNNDAVQLPYIQHHTIQTQEDATNVFSQYAFTYKEMNNINSLLDKNKTVVLTVKVEEEVTEKEKKQEATFEVVETVDLTEEIKTKWKKGRKKKWN